MKYCQLGSTGMLVSRLGLGTVKFGRSTCVNYPHGFDIPDDKSLRNLLATSKELGINLLDTAPAYGTCEERLGRLLKKDRNNWIITTKAGEEFDGNGSMYNFSAKHIRMSIERSLKQLRTDYIDILLIHSDGNDENIILNDHVFETLEHIKQRGLVRAYGMSTKTIEGGKLATQHADVVMLTYNLRHKTEDAVIQESLTNKKGVIIKKAFASGSLLYGEKNDSSSVLKNSMQFIFSTPGVHSIIMGTINQTHLQENIAIANQVLSSY